MGVRVMGWFEDVVVPACLALLCLSMATFVGFLIYRLATCDCQQGFC